MLNIYPIFEQFLVILFALWEEEIVKVSSLYFDVNIRFPPLWPHPPSKDHDNDELELSLSRDAFKKASTFICGEDFLKQSFYMSFGKLEPQLCHHPTSGDHDFNNIQYTLHRKAFT